MKNKSPDVYPEPAGLFRPRRLHGRDAGSLDGGPVMAAAGAASVGRLEADLARHVLAARDGDRSAFGRLVDASKGAVTSIALAICGDVAPSWRARRRSISFGCPIFCGFDSWRKSRATWSGSKPDWRSADGRPGWVW